MNKDLPNNFENMFERAFVTRGISETFTPFIQKKIWDMISDMKKRGISADYFQLFKVSSKNGTVTIKHSQSDEMGYEEVEEELKVIDTDNKDVFDVTVYIIDDGSGKQKYTDCYGKEQICPCTMLLSDEY